MDKIILYQNKINYYNNLIKNKYKLNDFNNKLNHNIWSSKLYRSYDDIINNYNHLNYIYQIYNINNIHQNIQLI